VIARYEYDALNRRTKEFINADTDDDFDSFRHFYYTFGWQLLETRLSTSENTEPQTLQPEYQYVWSVRYMDAPVLRDKNTDSDDLCDDERLYYANDANMNVTALLATDGTPLERYAYDPYGKVTIYDGTWTNTRNTSSYDNSILFCGYYRDNETGLYHVRNRYYYPYFGWITRDPAGYADGMSLYEYCASGPWARRTRWVFARPRVRPARRDYGGQAADGPAFALWAMAGLRCASTRRGVHPHPCPLPCLRQASIEGEGRRRAGGIPRGRDSLQDRVAGNACRLFPQTQLSSMSPELTWRRRRSPSACGRRWRCQT